MRDVYLLRHAESTANAGLATETPESMPLTAKGQAQAAALAAAFEVEPAVIVHSPFERARATAAPLIARYPRAQVLELPVQEFTYLNPATWRGTTAEQRWPAVEAYWKKADPLFSDGPGTENFLGLLQRADRLLEWLDESPDSPICIVSHGIFICSVLWRLREDGEGEPSAQGMRDFRAWQQASPPLNASVTRLCEDADGTVRVSPTLALWTPELLAP